MSHYTFAMHTAVTSGPGSVETLHRTVGELGGSRPLIVTDPALEEAGVVGRAREFLPESEVFDGVRPDPDVDTVLAAQQALEETGADSLVAIGGGSSIDTAKLAAMLAANDGDLVEHAANWDDITKPGLPLVAVPTTVGSGSEMTRGAVFGDPKTHSKLVVVTPHLAPRVAVLDPTLLETLPAKVTAATGADALTQAIEGVLSMAANPFTDALHLQAIRMIKDTLGRAVADSTDTEAMSGMQQAAAMAGAGIAYSAVGADHAIANTLGGHYHIPHGVACAIMLKPVLRFNATAVPERYRLIADALGIETRGLSDEEAAEGVVEVVSRLVDDIGVTWRLREYDVPEDGLPAIAQEAKAHSDMATNPRQPTASDVEALLQEVH